MKTLQIAICGNLGKTVTSVAPATRLNHSIVIPQTAVVLVIRVEKVLTAN